MNCLIFQIKRVAMFARTVAPVFAAVVLIATPAAVQISP